jgi:hypothetical protein
MRAGRLLRDLARDRATPTDPARHRAIGEQANREMMERFAPLTAENAQAAIEWQERRIGELAGGD